MASNLSGSNSCGATLARPSDEQALVAVAGRADELADDPVAAGGVVAAAVSGGTVVTRSNAAVLAARRDAALVRVEESPQDGGELDRGKRRPRASPASRL